MPAKSKAQQRFFGAELARRKAGKKTRTGMSTADMEDYAATKHKGLPKQSKKSPRR